MSIRGKVLKYGDNIDTDQIINNQHAALSGPDPKAQGRYCLRNLDPTFAERVRQGDVLVAGTNFGCGSAKPAAIALMGAGIECVIAKSFSRLFFRNALNLGLLPIESAELAEAIREGDELEIDLESEKITNHKAGWSKPLPEYPAPIRRVIECGGLMNWLRTSTREAD